VSTHFAISGQSVPTLFLQDLDAAAVSRESLTFTSEIV